MAAKPDAVGIGVQVARVLVAGDEEEPLTFLEKPSDKLRAPVHPGDLPDPRAPEKMLEFVAIVFRGMIEVLRQMLKACGKPVVRFGAERQIDPQTKQIEWDRLVLDGPDHRGKE